MKSKTYLGDGVYAKINNYGQLVLTTENGIEVTNKIILEAEVFQELLRYAEVGKEKS